MGFKKRPGRRLYVSRTHFADKVGIWSHKPSRHHCGAYFWEGRSGRPPLIYIWITQWEKTFGKENTPKPGECIRVWLYGVKE